MSAKKGMDMDRRDFLKNSLILGTPLAMAYTPTAGAQDKLAAYEAMGTPEEVRAALESSLKVVRAYTSLGSLREIKERLDELDRYHKDVGRSPEYCIEVAERWSRIHLNKGVTFPVCEA